MLQNASLLETSSSRLKAGSKVPILFKNSIFLSVLEETKAEAPRASAGICSCLWQPEEGLSVGTGMPSRSSSRSSLRGFDRQTLLPAHMLQG